MGNSSDGILFFGYEIKRNDDYEYPKCISDDYENDNYLDPEDYYAIQVGIKPPPKYDENIEGNWEKVKPEYNIFWDKRREVVDKCPCEIMHLCYWDDASHAVVIKETVLKSYWGSPKPIDLNLINKDKTEWIKQIIEYSNIMNIPYDINDIKWYLSSMYV